MTLLYYVKIKPETEVLNWVLRFGRRFRNACFVPFAVYRPRHKLA